MSIKKNTTNTLKHSGLSFTTIINQTMDLIPTAEAMGIYCYLSSKPEGWIIREKELMTRFNRGRDFIRSTLRTLKEIGLLKIEIIRAKSGKIAAWKTVLLNHITENPSSGENHITEKPASGSTSNWSTHPHINNIYIQNKEDYKTYAHFEEKCHTEPQNTDLIEHEEKAQITFEQFWELYPLKKSKARALAAWYSQSCYLEVDKILAALRQQIANDQDFLNGFIPHPARYIMEQRWQDEIRKANKAPKRIGELDFSSRDWAKDVDFNSF